MHQAKGFIKIKSKINIVMTTIFTATKKKWVIKWIGIDRVNSSLNFTYSFLTILKFLAMSVPFKEVRVEMSDGKVYAVPENLLMDFLEVNKDSVKEGKYEKY